jgi:glyoxylase-like metal-dependent hydrolase (beta-lactamase superfamily II)
VNRRTLLKTAAGGALALWARPRVLGAQETVLQSLRGNAIGVASVGGNNVLGLRTLEGLVLVDSGAPNTSDKVLAGIRSITAGGANKVQVLFNTHYHLDQTGNNEIFAADGARIIAHEHTRQWMSADHWVPAQERYEKARAVAALPTETFRTASSLRVRKVGGAFEDIEYGHLPLAHTDGDIYVFFKPSNVLAVGDVASPLLDPSLDWFTGAWIGGRIDAMDAILKLANDQTKIVPATGSVMSRVEFKEERDMMEEIRSRIWKHTLNGEGAKQMLEAGVMKDLSRTWKDPLKFLYDAGKGMFAHHNKLDPSMN